MFITRIIISLSSRLLHMASRSFRCFVEQEMGTFLHFVIYAILEWALIALLFVHGFIAFISDEFAKYFELKIPCLICSRIDHLITCKNSSFYYNESICESHKKVISSLAYCHIHRKLSDIKTMCEGCLLSFATERESVSIVGIVNKDIDSSMEDELKTKLKSTVGRREREEVVKDEKGFIQRCSCCGDFLKMRQSSKNLAQISMMAQAPTPSPRAQPLMWKNEEGRGIELPHIRYTELKLRQEVESSLVDDEFGSNSARKEENKADSVPLLPESDDIFEEVKTPSFQRGNKFFGIPLTDSATVSPRFARLTKKLQLDKLELIPELNDKTNGNGNDSVLNHLKKQVRLDRKTLIEMYMELDEERSASAVAANNAMAMITRLQAEKAAVQMEALQYQRMMEEQAEYDEEAIQVMKDDLKVLERELDTYRERYGPVNRIGSEMCEMDDDENYQELKSQSISTISERSDCGSPEHKTTDESSLDFEGERSYLLGLLADLETKLIGSSDYKPENEDTGVGHMDALAKDVCFMRERLRAIEADSGFLKHAAMTFQKGGEGTKLLTEIALHLRRLRQSPKVLSGDVDA